MKTAIAGAVVYKIAIKTNAIQLISLRLSLLTVKNEQLRAVILQLTIVIAKTSTTFRTVCVY
jgi:hypothetical protein